MLPTHVSSLHFLIHFIHPSLPYRQIKIEDFLMLCGFDGNVNLSDALHSLRVNIGKFTDCVVADPSASAGDTPLVLPNEVQSLRQIPSKFWQLCHNVLQFRTQRPSNLPVSVKGIYTWNLNSWSPGLPTNAHKTWIVKTMLKQAPVLLQETKWNQANLQYLSHTWPDIKVVTTLAKQNPGEQAGVAILFPPVGKSWKNVSWFSTMLLQLALNTKLALYGLFRSTSLRTALSLSSQLLCKPFLL